MYEKTAVAGWADMDFNAHMRNTAYLDKAADVRMTFFSEHGFPMARFVELRMGPVVMKDEVEYFREVGLLETLRVTFALAGLAPDGSRMMLRNEFHRSTGQKLARVTSTAGWLDLAARRLVSPPADLLAAMQALPRAEDYRELPSSLR